VERASDLLQKDDTLGIFLYRRREDLAKRIAERANHMVQQGMVEELRKFREDNRGKDLSDLTLPIGYEQVDELESKYEEGLDWADRDKAITKFWVDFCGANRKYIKQQKSYWRSKLSWLHGINLSIHDPQEVSNLINNVVKEGDTLSLQRLSSMNDDSSELTDKEYWDLINQLNNSFEHYL